MRAAVDAVDLDSARALVEVDDHVQEHIAQVVADRLERRGERREAAVLGLDIEAVILRDEIEGIRAVLGRQPHHITRESGMIGQGKAEIEAPRRLVVEITQQTGVLVGADIAQAAVIGV